MKQCQLNYINSILIKQASKLQYTVSDTAPSTTIELFNAPSLVIWSGASDLTIFNDAFVNYAFRAIHDSIHIDSKLPLTIDAEIELARIQASKYTSDLMRELIYTEVAGQVEYYKEHGIFPVDQAAFVNNELMKRVG